MDDNRISIGRSEELWVVRGGGSVLAESRAALRLEESGHAPVIYFPRADVAMALLEPSPTRTTCPFKGEATYFALQTQSVLVRDVAWSYEAPHEEVREISGHLAFDPEKVAVEQL